MKQLTDLKVGDTVWIGDVNARGAGPLPATVQKVGRKLMTVDRRVFRMDTGYANDGYSHHWVIPDLDEWKQRQERDRLWTSIRASYRLDNAVTLADLREAVRLLRLEA